MEVRSSRACNHPSILRNFPPTRHRLSTAAPAFWPRKRGRFRPGPQPVCNSAHALCGQSRRVACTRAGWEHPDRSREVAMLAAWYEAKGAARDVLRYGELPDPEPGPGELRVRVRASGVNPTDVKAR